MIQSLEQEVALGACLSVSGTVRNSKTSTKVLSLILNCKNRRMWEQECIKWLISRMRMHLPTVRLVQVAARKKR